MPDFGATNCIVTSANVTSSTASTVTLSGANVYTTSTGSYTVTVAQLDAFLRTAYTISTVYNQWPAQHNARIITGAPFVPRKKTEAEIAAELRLHAEYEKRNAERHARELAARARAERLLLANLTAEQRETLLGRGFFEVKAKSGQRYKIGRSTHGNIVRLDDRGVAVARLCAQPSGVPVDDAILAQKLALETDEAAFLRVANVHAA